MLSLVVAAGCSAREPALDAGAGSGDQRETPHVPEPPPRPAQVADVLAPLPGGVHVAPANEMEALIDAMGGASCKDDPDAAAVAAIAADERGPLSPLLVPPGPGEPRLWVVELDAAEGGVVDVGPIPRDAPSDHRFTVLNAGTAELRITGLSASCGCTGVRTESEALAPGERTVLHVTYDPAAAEEDGDRIAKYIRFRTNDPARPLAELTFVGHLTP